MLNRNIRPCTYRPFDFIDMVLGIKNVFDIKFLVCEKERAKKQSQNKTKPRDLNRCATVAPPLFHF